MTIMCKATFRLWRFRHFSQKKEELFIHLISLSTLALNNLLAGL